MKFEDSHRKYLMGGGTVAGVLIFLAIIIAIQYIMVQNPRRWDLTRGKRFTLATQSKNVLDTFREKKIPVEVLAFYESKDQGAREEVRDLLEQYRDVYPDLTYSFVDPDTERAVALKNKIDSYPTIVVKAGQKDERISTADEETVTNALMKLLRTDVKKVYLLKGHGELPAESTGDSGFSTAREQIEKQNYKVEEIVLMQAVAVPEDASILVIAGPKTDPMDTELEAMRSFIGRGGSLLVMLNPFKSPKLAEFLKEYGFVTADDIVVDRMSRVLGGDYLMPVITTYVKFPITKNFTLASFFPEVRSVRTAEKPVSKVEAQGLAMTSAVSWTINEEQLTSGNANFDEKTGIKGPVSVMAVSQYTTSGTPGRTLDNKGLTSEGPEKEQTSKTQDQSKEDQASTGEQGAPKPKKARIVVFGSSLLAANKFYKLQGNGDLFMNTVSWLAEDENLISIRPKSLRSNPLVLTARESMTTFLIPVVLIPLAWIAAGIAVFVYRRRAVKV
ncbi:MAG: Gldg family protein [Deltaproteobacteria bacterium]|nr:Gldg family protein [Deltaproteobacteria bacterium]